MNIKQCKPYQQKKTLQKDFLKTNVVTASHPLPHSIKCCLAEGRKSGDQCHPSANVDWEGLGFLGKERIRLLRFVLWCASVLLTLMGNRKDIHHPTHKTAVPLILKYLLWNKWTKKSEEGALANPGLPIKMPLK